MIMSVFSCSLSYKTGLDRDVTALGSRQRFIVPTNPKEYPLYVRKIRRRQPNSSLPYSTKSRKRAFIQKTIRKQSLEKRLTQNKVKDFALVRTNFMVTAATNVFLSCILVLRRFKNGQEFSTNNEQHDRLCLDVNVKLEDLIMTVAVIRAEKILNNLQSCTTGVTSHHLSPSSQISRKTFSEKLTASNWRLDYVCKGPQPTGTVFTHTRKDKIKIC